MQNQSDLRVRFETRYVLRYRDRRAELQRPSPHRGACPGSRGPSGLRANVDNAAAMNDTRLRASVAPAEASSFRIGQNRFVTALNRTWSREEWLVLSRTKKKHESGSSSGGSCGLSGSTAVPCHLPLKSSIEGTMDRSKADYRLKTAARWRSPNVLQDIQRAVPVARSPRVNDAGPLQTRIAGTFNATKT